MNADSKKTLMDAFQAAADAQTGKLKPGFQKLNKKLGVLIKKIEAYDKSKSIMAGVEVTLAAADFIDSFAKFAAKVKNDPAAKVAYDDLAVKVKTNLNKVTR